MKKVFPVLSGLLILFPLEVLAGHGASLDGGPSFGQVLFWIAIILLAAKVSGLIKKMGQPTVLGEIGVGIILGNLSFLGIMWFEPLRDNQIIKFLAEFGVVILLFQIGLESNITEMKKVGPRALLVAIIGVVAPFLLGTFLVGPMLMPGLEFNSYLFLGAILTATSVGITARVFKDLKKQNSRESKIVLGAAVIDDVLGLIILAVVSAVVTVGSVNTWDVLRISGEAILFLVAAIFLGGYLAPKIGRLFSAISTGVSMKFTLALSFGLILAFLAEKIGLAPIIGAFAAGLILDPVHFRYFKDHKMAADFRKLAEKEDGPVKEKIISTIEPYAKRHIEDLIEPLANFLVPVFFVMIGFSVDVKLLFNIPILLVALGVTVAAFLGKMVSGLGAGKANKLAVGMGMVPRGEVGLIFAMIGRSLGVISEEMFSVVIIMVILSTLLTPPALSYILGREKKTREEKMVLERQAA